MPDDDALRVLSAIGELGNAIQWGEVVKRTLERIECPMACHRSAMLNVNVLLAAARRAVAVLEAK